MLERISSVTQKKVYISAEDGTRIKVKTAGHGK